MFRSRFIPAALSLTLLLTGASIGVAGKFNKVVEIGDQAPQFEGLMGVDDRSHSFQDYKDADVVVLCFTCNHCPVAVAYEDRFVEFVKDYKGKGVAFIAVNVNNLPADRLDQMKQRAADKGFNFDYLYDPSQKIGRAYGAIVTPHVFVLGKDRQIAYMGAFDDNINPAKVKREHVRQAVDALLSGKSIEVAETLQRGCSIKYE